MTSHKTDLTRERKDFEAWIRRTSGLSTARYDDKYGPTWVGEYITGQVAQAWAAWQAALRSLETNNAAPSQPDAPKLFGGGETVIEIDENGKVHAPKGSAVDELRGMKRPQGMLLGPKDADALYETALSLARRLDEAKRLHKEASENAHQHYLLAGEWKRRYESAEAKLQKWIKVSELIGEARKLLTEHWSGNDDWRKGNEHTWIGRADIALENAAALIPPAPEDS